MFKTKQDAINLCNRLEKRLPKNYLLRDEQGRVITPNEKTLEDFVLNFLKVYADNSYTWQDSKKICNKFKNRSIQDVYSVAKSYFPDTTLAEVIRILSKLYLNKKISYWECYVVKRIVFAGHPGYPSDITGEHSKNYGNLFNYFLNPLNH
jgi:hypothetical protein